VENRLTIKFQVRGSLSILKEKGGGKTIAANKKLGRKPYAVI